MKAVKAKIVISVKTVYIAMMRVALDGKQTMPKQRKMKTMKRKRRQS